MSSEINDRHHQKLAELQLMFAMDWERVEAMVVNRTGHESVTNLDEGTKSLCFVSYTTGYARAMVEAADAYVRFEKAMSMLRLRACVFAMSAIALVVFNVVWSTYRVNALKSQLQQYEQMSIGVSDPTAQDAPQ